MVWSLSGSDPVQYLLCVLRLLLLRCCRSTFIPHVRIVDETMRLKRPAFYKRLVSILKTYGELTLVSGLMLMAPPLLNAQQEISFAQEARQIERAPAQREGLIVTSLHVDALQTAPASTCGPSGVQPDGLNEQSAEDAAETDTPNGEMDDDDVGSELSCAATPAGHQIIARFREVRVPLGGAGPLMIVPVRTPITLAARGSREGADETGQAVPTAALWNALGAGQVPQRSGFNLVDGAWSDKEYKYGSTAVTGVLYTKVGMGSGLISRNTLTYTQADISASFTLGRNQDTGLDIYDQAELVVGVAEQAVGSLPLSVSYSVSGGWFREPTTPQISRVQYFMGLETRTIPLSPTVTWQASGSWQDARYGTADRQGVLKINTKLILQGDEKTSLNLSYDQLGMFGATPFNFDAVDTNDLTNDLSLEYVRTGTRTPDVTTSFHTGVSYSFLDHTPSLVIGYSEDAAERLRWNLDVGYDLISHDTTLSIGYGLPIGRGTGFMIRTSYENNTGLFKDLDYLIASQIQDCTKLELGYRQVRQEFWLEVDPQSCASP